MKPIVKFLTCGAINPEKREIERIERARKKMEERGEDVEAGRAQRY